MLTTSFPSSPPLESSLLNDLSAELEERAARIEARIQSACARAGRFRSEVQLITVTKGHPLELCQRALAQGLTDLGESYVQEFVPKSQAMDTQTPSPRWHFIGRIQTNKINQLVGRTTLIHSVDRPSVLEKISARACTSQCEVAVLLQVNIAGEGQKAGVAPDSLRDLAQRALGLPGVRLGGLMTIPPIHRNAEESRAVFRHLKQERDSLREQLDGLSAGELHHLSMGMSSDFEVAIEEGATLIRVGTALVGQRPRQ